MNCGNQMAKNTVKKADGTIKGEEFTIAFCSSDWENRIHIHDCYEFEMLLEGELELQLNGRQFDVKYGNFWLSLPNNLHRVVKKTDDVKVLSIKFGDKFLSGKVYNLLGMYGDGIMGTATESEVKSFLNVLDVVFDTYVSTTSELCKNIFIRNVIEAILVAFVDKCDDFANDVTEEVTEHNIFEAVSYVKKHFTEELTANEMAKRLGYTPNYFSMKYKSLTGKNFIDSVNDERLQLAYYMLSTMDISVNEVSEYVGYSSVAYFSRMFKKKFGKSPREVKNRSGDI